MRQVFPKEPNPPPEFPNIEEARFTVECHHLAYSSFLSLEDVPALLFECCMLGEALAAALLGSTRSTSLPENLCTAVH